MDFKDILDLFKQGKASARSHMRNLIEIAVADGGFAVEEQRLLEYAAMRNDISSSELKKIRANASQTRFKVPGNENEKFLQLYELVQMMTVDENIHAEEMRLCEIFAIKFGYRKEIVREMIEIIKDNIKNWVGAKETLQSISKSMKIYE